MRRLTIFLRRTFVSITVATLLVVCAGTVAAADERSNSVDPGTASPLVQTDGSQLRNDDASSPWPLEVKDNGRTFLIYQPEIDKWENNRLDGRSAVSVRSDADGPPNFGMIYFSARTDPDGNNRTLVVHDAVVSKADFPAVAGDDYLAVLRSRFGAHSWRIAQDRLQSDMEIDKVAQQSEQQPVRNDPPRILFSERPAVLVPIDGHPVTRPVADTGLLRVVNTRALILQDKATSRYFLYLSDHWMAASKLEGPWSSAANVPAQLEQAKQIATQQDQVDLLQNAAGNANETAVPASLTVFVTTVPTELVQSDGRPQYAPIEHTQLLYVTNSPNKLFLDLRTQNHYALISGRWFRTTALANGQWSYVPPAELPGDFAMIPADHPTESVRAAVPGTPQAREAVIANSVPETATVTRSAARLDVVYDGDPVFQPIEGTALQNAINSPVPVIRVNADSFYALNNGVWFVASSPFGPWSVASNVPAVIYSIPRSSPLHYVTYVRIYDATPEVVYVGYTPGHVGSYVSSGVVVYGTGWPYYPWIGSVWYGAPCTWGFGFSFVYSWWHPYPWYGYHPHYHYHYPAAWASPRPYYHPWWGPWHQHAPHAGFAAGGHGSLSGPGRHDVAHIYDRWGHNNVAPHGPRQWTSPSRQAPGNGFAGRTGHVQDRRITDYRNPERARGARQVPGRTAPSGQTPWRRPSSANQQNHAGGQSAPQMQPRVQHSTAGDNARGSMENRVVAPAARQQGRGMDRPREIAQDNLQPPSRQWTRPATPMGRAPSSGMPPTQNARSPSRNNAPAMSRIERPAMTNPGRGMDRPAVHTGPSAQPAPARANPGNGRSHGGGQWSGHNGHH